MKALVSGDCQLCDDFQSILFIHGEQTVNVQEHCNTVLCNVMARAEIQITVKKIFNGFGRLGLLGRKWTSATYVT